LYFRDFINYQAYASYHSTTGRVRLRQYQEFSEKESYFAVINFVGVVAIANTINTGSEILDVSNKFDNLALNYLKKQPNCRYLFMSSGAAYGGSFASPAEERSNATFSLNNFDKKNLYGIAKAYAECRHRALCDSPIIDLRLFNYISPNINLASQFLAAEAIRAIRDNTVLQTSSDELMRDYLHPVDFNTLINALLESPPANDVVDAYSQAPIKKNEMLQVLQDKFGLVFEYAETPLADGVAGNKINYYTLNHRASRFGYVPSMTSLDGILDATNAILRQNND
jgi:nucleoside-diphosphate-sugar epimerase